MRIGLTFDTASPAKDTTRALFPLKARRSPLGSPTRSVHDCFGCHQKGHLQSACLVPRFEAQHRGPLLRPAVAPASPAPGMCLLDRYSGSSFSPSKSRATSLARPRELAGPVGVHSPNAAAPLHIARSRPASSDHLIRRCPMAR